MAIVINGDGSISGISAGGLPTGSVTADTLATNSVDSAELIDGAVDDSHLATGIDATKLADGTVTSTELQYINTLASNAQTQISAAGGLGEVSFVQDIYDNTTASGTYAVTGSGFTPKMVIIQAGSIVDKYWSLGFGFGLNSNIMQHRHGTADNVVVSIAEVASHYISASTRVMFDMKSMDADGYTMDVAKIGSPTGVTYINSIFFK